ncbi:MAG TPA: methyltransferase domain-containing protein [Chromatiaceae bacterium]|nr:methyltransferase domain-containing protein [Chromatiaceae bacterium]
MTKIESLDIPAWGSAEALRKEEHVARFLAREYKMLVNKPVTVDGLNLCPSSGALSEQTADLMDTHYDEKLAFFEGFLDTHYRAYTMAYYGETPEAVRNTDISLEEAQRNKFRLICERIGIQGAERILNIGCGFGSFEQYLFENYPDIEVIGVTPSVIQTSFLNECMNDSGHFFHGKNFTVVQKDLESLNDEDVTPGSFDVVTSIGLVCAIKNLEELHDKVFKYLKPGGKAFHHLITSKPVIPQFLDPTQSLIGDYFPGGRIWPFDELPRHAKNLELINSWFINGMNYWTTLDEWHKRFWSNIEEIRKHLPAKRIRFWSDYFILCKACFLPKEGAFFGNGHYLFQKPE